MPAALSAPVDALPPGAVISERYKLLKALGQGGFGITYIAWDAKLARKVAVKECFPAALCRRDPMSGAVAPLSAAAEDAYLAALDDMHKEAKTLAQAEHARVLRIHDVIWGNGSVFLIMPWLSGGSLAERIADAAHLPTEEQQLAWLADILEGLAYLHGKGIIHRDLKPANILFDDDGRPVIIDLGAALNRNPADFTRSTTTRGAFSPGYASPEQATGKGKIGPWTDFYSLAATWYELLTGTRPEDAEKRLMEDDMVPLSAATLRIPCPREVVALLQRNLSLRPAERCASAADWQNVLRGGSLPPLPRRSLRAILLALGLGVAALAAVGVSLIRPQGAQTPRTPEEKQEEVDEAAASLENKLRRLYQVDAYLADLQEVAPKVETIGDRIYAAEENSCKKWLDAMDTQEYKDEHAFADPCKEEEPAEIPEPGKGRVQRSSISLDMVYFQRYTQNAASCREEFRRECLKLKEKKRFELVQQGLGTGEIAKQYRPADMQEAAVLPTVAAKIDREVQEALAQFDAAVDSYEYTSDYSAQSRRKAVQKWNDMVRADAESRPRELESLVNKIREVAGVDAYLKNRESIRARYEAILTEIRRKEDELLETYQARIKTADSSIAARDLRREIQEQEHATWCRYQEKLRAVAQECHAADNAFNRAYADMKLSPTPREKRLLDEAQKIVKKSIPDCNCYSWTNFSLSRLHNLAVEFSA